MEAVEDRRVAGEVGEEVAGENYQKMMLLQI